MKIKKIEVVSYDPKWPEIFDKEALLIKNALGSNFIDVHHIGSTAVPGLCAKPKIDVIVVVKDSRKAKDPLETIGYVCKGELNIPFRLYSAKYDPHKINMHLYEEGHPEIKLNIMFRDYLRSHPKVRDEYGALKMKLASDALLHKKTDHGFTGYNLGKDQMIKKILDAAGFNELCFRFCMHYDEWQFAKNINSNASPSDETHKHFVLYKGTEIIGYASVKLEDSKIEKLYILDEHSNPERENYFRGLCEKWIPYIFG